MALLLGLAVFFLADVKADAAAAKKETPLTNLAEGKIPTLPNGQEVMNGQLVTDGDKYSDVIITNSTKSYPADATKTLSINWNSLGTVADIGNEDYLQIDLEGEYSIEVINLKRRWRNVHGSGNISNTPKGHEFQNTAIVLASTPDFSDAKVIYYQNEADIKSHLPNAAITATKQGATYNETYGGAWFYVGGDGTTPTAPQTVMKARYIRVYSDAPTSSAFGTAENGFVELAVYGYKEEGRKAEAVRTKRTIDASNPLFIVPCYSSNYYNVGQQGEPTFKGNETITGRWNATPAHLQKYHVLLAHTDNLGMVGGQQFNNNHATKIDRQRLLQEFYEHCLQIGYENDIPVMLMGITASAQPVVYNDDDTVKYGGTNYNITAMMDYGWLDLMYRMYPNMEGTFNTENHWSGNFGGVAEGSGKQLNIAARHNGYFAWTERSDTLDNAAVTGNTVWTNAVKENGDHLYMMYKSTGAVGGKEYATQSYMQGLWLGGYAAGWGGLIDTWAWSNTNQGPLGSAGGGGWKAVVAYPENMIGIGLLSMYLEGACIYTLEHPNYTYGVDDKNSPAYTHAVVEAMNFIVKHPAPGKKDILERTKVLVYGRGANIYTGLVGQAGKNYFLYDTSRYGSLPVIADWKTRDEIAQELSRVCNGYGIEVPLLLNVSDPILTGSGRIPFFEEKYPLEYEGNAFADIWNDDWYVYNNEYDPNVIDEGQTVILPLISGGNDTIRLKTSDLKAHTYFVVDQQITGDKMELYINNYRTDKTGLFTGNIPGVDFRGGDLAMAADQRSCLGLEQYVRLSTQNAADDTLRTTTWELTKVTEAPTVRVIEAMAQNGSSPQYTEPTVQFDQSTGKATISIQTNGWVKMEIGNLKFATDTVEPVTQRVNVASGGSVKLSGQRDISGRPAFRFTDEDTSKAKYVEMADGAQWVQVDMGQVHKIEELQLWRYWDEPEGRSYKDTVILLSPDENFDPSKTLVLWNACSNPDSVTWPAASQDNTIANNVNIPVGDEPIYPETQEGKTFSVSAPEVEWLDGEQSRPKPVADSENYYFEARYVRIYQNGRADSTQAHNHLVELKVWGERGGVQITDNGEASAPTD